jgi:hypothetical protein
MTYKKTALKLFQKAFKKQLVEWAGFTTEPLTL